ncbi:MAG: SRPBCC domain-containing protein [Flavobacteriaceae bacterium]
MKKIQFKIDIYSPVAKVYKTMLGLEDKSTYEAWTAEFNPTSTYEGSWEKGSKILFIGTGEDGEKGGMIAEIAENIPNRFVSIRHYGILKGNTEITSGEEVEKWAGGEENYSFEEQNGITTITVEVDVIEDYLDYFHSTYPKALQKLKEIVEK